MVVLDSAGNVIWANSLAEQLFDGRCTTPWVNRGSISCIPDDLELAALSLVSIRKESEQRLEVRLKTPSGWRLVELIGTPVNWLRRVRCSSLSATSHNAVALKSAHDEVALFRMLVQNAATITMLISPAAISALLPEL